MGIYFQQISCIYFKHTESLHEKCPNTEFFSGPYIPLFSPSTGKYGPEKTPCLDTFHAVIEEGLANDFDPSNINS